ncbi:hypothetical protein Gasu2_14980 [Galdieria sulphuraria]|nr:hypothetical protein Gasu2_14980 [Galdieria sulphuraria]
MFLFEFHGVLFRNHCFLVVSRKQNQWIQPSVEIPFGKIHLQHVNRLLSHLGISLYALLWWYPNINVSNDNF